MFGVWCKRPFTSSLGCKAHYSRRIWQINTSTSSMALLSISVLLYRSFTRTFSSNSYSVCCEDTRSADCVLRMIVNSFLTLAFLLVLHFNERLTALKTIIFNGLAKCSFIWRLLAVLAFRCHSHPCYFWFTRWLHGKQNLGLSSLSLCCERSHYLIRFWWQF